MRSSVLLGPSSSIMFSSAMHSSIFCAGANPRPSRASVFERKRRRSALEGERPGVKPSSRIICSIIGISWRTGPRVVATVIFPGNSSYGNRRMTDRTKPPDMPNVKSAECPPRRASSTVTTTPTVHTARVNINCLTDRNGQKYRQKLCASVAKKINGGGVAESRGTGWSSEIGMTASMSAATNQCIIPVIIRRACLGRCRTASSSSMSDVGCTD